MADIKPLGVRAVVENLDAYVRDLRRMTGVTDDTGEALNRAGKQSQSFGKAAASTAVGLAAADLALRGLSVAAKVTVGSFLSFEQGLADAGAVAKATDRQMGQMADSALRIGRDTKFSAGEAAGAFEKLAASGMSVESILGGAADASAALAAAGGVDLPLAADVMSTAMAVFGLSADQAGEAANRLAGAANVSRFGVQDMAAAVAQGAGAAKVAGVSFGDFATAIAAIAPNFASGSDAGTSFKTFLTRLIPSSKEAEGAMRDLGLITADGANQFVDASGKIKGMAEVSQILHDKLGPLTDAQKLNALQTIFGTDALRAAAAMSEITADKFRAMDETMRTTDAAEVAARRMDTLKGRLDNMRSSLETAAIQIMTGIAPALNTLVEGLTMSVNAFAGLPQGTQAIILLAAAMALLGPKVLDAARSIVHMIATMRTEGVSSSVKFAGAIGGITLAFVAADIAASKLTGHGIVDWLSGAARAADRAAEAQGAMNAALLAAGAGADKVQVLTAAITREAEASRAAQNALDEHSGSLLENLGALNTAKARVQAFAQALVDQQVPLSTLTDIYRQLPPHLQKVFDETANVTAAMALQSQGFDQAVELLERGGPAWDAIAASEAGLTGEIKKGEPAWLAHIHSLETAKERIDALNHVLDELEGRFADLNPLVIAAQTANAILGEELEDLKDKGDKVTAAERERIKVLETTIEKNAAYIKTQKDNQEANEAYRKSISLLAGPEGYGLIQKAVEASGLVLEEQTNTIGRVAQAYVNLKGPGGIGAALEGLALLRDDLGSQSEAWKTIAATLGPAFLAEIETGIADPAERKRLGDAAYSLGLATGQGMAGGLHMAQADIIREATANADALLVATQQALQISSPSLLMQEIGEQAGEGLALGIDGSAGAVAEGASALVDAAFDALAGPSGITAWSDIGRISGQAIGDAAVQSIGEAVMAAPEAANAALLGPSGLTTWGQIGRAIGEAITAPVLTLMQENLVAAAGNAMDLMQTSFADRATEIKDQDELGRMGAAVMDSLREALATGSDRAFAAMGKGLADLEAEAKSKLKPAEYAALMKAVTDAMNTVIRTGGAEGVQALRDAIRAMHDAVETGSRPVIDLVHTFADEMADVMRRMEEEDQFGRTGATIIEQLRAGIEEKSPAAIAAAARTAGSLMEEMDRELDPTVSAGLGKALIAALEKAVTDGGGAALEALKKLLEEIKDQVAAAKDASGGGPVSGGSYTGKTAAGPEGQYMNPRNGNILAGGYYQGGEYFGGHVVGHADMSAGNYTQMQQAGYQGSRAQWNAWNDEQKLAAWMNMGLPPQFSWPSHEGGQWKIGETGPAVLHAGEMVIPEAFASWIRGEKGAPQQGPWVSARQMDPIERLGYPGGGGSSVVFDMRGAVLTGTLEENERMMRTVARDVLATSIERDSFLYGRRGR